MPGITGAEVEHFLRGHGSGSGPVVLDGRTLES